MKPSNLLNTKTALLAVGGYAALCSLVYLRQQTILYRPAKPNRDTPQAGQILPQGGEGEPALNGWVDNPGQEHALIYFGGASEPIELRRDSLAKAFPNHTRYLMPYRGFGPNHRLHPDEGMIKKDAMRLAELVSAKHSRVHVIGRSLGTGVAIHVASRLPISALGLITPYDSILEVAKGTYRWLPVARMLRDRFESWRDALNINVPVFTCLAEIDKVVPRSRTEALLGHMRCKHDSCTIKGSNHRTIAQCDELWEKLSAFFHQDLEAQAIMASSADAPRRSRRLRSRA